MTSNEFVLWLRGFAEAASNFTLTPKQWDTLCEQLEKVQLEGESKQWRKYTLLDNLNWNTNTTQNIKND